LPNFSRRSDSRHPVLWKTSVTESSGGVYVVALAGEANVESEVSADYLPPIERKRWLPNEPVVYVGATECRKGLAGRIGQFYRHQYGKRSPHSGGQAVKLLQCGLWVYWSSATDPFGCEQAMLHAFRQRVGQLPFANRNAGGQSRRSDALGTFQSSTWISPFSSGLQLCRF